MEDLNDGNSTGSKRKSRFRSKTINQALWSVKGKSLGKFPWAFVFTRNSGFSSPVMSQAVGLLRKAPLVGDRLMLSCSGSHTYRFLGWTEKKVKMLKISSLVPSRSRS
jgi:hypothetical protein